MKRGTGMQTPCSEHLSTVYCSLQGAPRAKSKTKSALKYSTLNGAMTNFIRLNTGLKRSTKGPKKNVRRNATEMYF